MTSHHSQAPVNTNRPQSTAPAAPRRRSFMGLLIDGLFGQLGLALRALVASVVLSIVMEWVGIAFFWPEQGWHHSAAMVEQELGYLNRDFASNVLGFSQSAAIEELASATYYWLFTFTHIEQGLAWLGRETGLDNYLLAVPLVAQVFLLRLMVLLFSMPAFLLFAIVGASTGLTLRDIRRWSGGREFGRVYHRAKSTLPWALVFSWVLYLTWPVSVHPNWIVLPCAVLLGLNLLITTATYKKYL